jgi:hypothetical protein
MRRRGLPACAGPSHLLGIALATLQELASVIGPVVHLQNAVVVEEAGVDEHRDERVRVSLPLAGDGYVIGVVAAQITVGSVVERQEPRKSTKSVHVILFCHSGEGHTCRIVTWDGGGMCW